KSGYPSTSARPTHTISNTTSPNNPTIPISIINISTSESLTFASFTPNNQPNNPQLDLVDLIDLPYFCHGHHSSLHDPNIGLIRYHQSWKKRARTIFIYVLSHSSLE
ncbi:hypothetical protein PanWU01x14_367040, partial [Parasponia andersonii]